MQAYRKDFPVPELVEGPTFFRLLSPEGQRREGFYTG